jgi:hypothetical protein
LILEFFVCYVSIVSNNMLLYFVKIQSSFEGGMEGLAVESQKMQVSNADYNQRLEAEVWKCMITPRRLLITDCNTPSKQTRCFRFVCNFSIYL